MCIMCPRFLGVQKICPRIPITFQNMSNKAERSGTQGMFWTDFLTFSGVLDTFLQNYYQDSKTCIKNFFIHIHTPSLSLFACKLYIYIHMTCQLFVTCKLYSYNIYIYCMQSENGVYAEYFFLRFGIVFYTVCSLNA